MSNMYHSRLDKNEIVGALGNTVLTLVSGEDYGWFVDSDESLSSSDSDDDEIYKPCEEEGENETEFSDSGKG